MKAAIAIIASFVFVWVVEAKPARADLTYNIYELMNNVVVEASGSLILPASSSPDGNCGFVHGFLNPSNANICNGPDDFLASRYSMAGPASFGGGGAAAEASSSSGIFTQINGITGVFGIDNSYISGTPILGSSTFNGKTLADFGLTPTPSAGMWTLSNGEKINVKVTPGPLPVFGAVAAYGFSRRLRRRIQINKVGVNS